MAKVRAFFAELIRRQMFRTLGAYIVIIWGLAQGFAGLFPSFGVPDWVLRAFIYASVAATPLVVIVAWKYQFTMQGLVRDPADEQAELDGTSRYARRQPYHRLVAVRG